MIRYVNAPHSSFHGCKVEPVPDHPDQPLRDGLGRYKLLEPTTSPGVKMGDIITLHKSEISARRV